VALNLKLASAGFSQVGVQRLQPSHNGCAMLEDGCNAGSSAPTSYKWVELLIASPRVLLGAIAESLAITVSRYVINLRGSTKR
jgi:hypothetical protein